MKARLLKKLLNDTGYAVCNNPEYIAIGSAYVHNLISVDMKTLKVNYALDTFGVGRAAISGKELCFIWDKLHELIESGKIQEVINGKDEIENPLSVYTVTDGKLIESVTDKYGWPNTDDDGVCMFANAHFETREDAIKKGIQDNESIIEWVQQSIEEYEEKLAKLKEKITNSHAAIANLTSLL